MPTVKAGSVNIHYEVTGKGDPLLLIMGFGMPGMAWFPTLPFLQEFQSIFFDNRGTGDSDKPADGPYTVKAMADDASHLLDALGIKRAFVYGVSMGGMIAQQLALDHPEQVAKAVLGCTWCGGTVSAHAPEEVIQQLLESTKLMSNDADKSLDMLLPLLYPPEFLAGHPEIKAMMLAALAAVPAINPEIAERTLVDVAEFDVSGRVSEIKCPALIVHGDRDVIIPPANAEILRSRIPRSEVLMIPGAGHAFSGIDPAGVHQRITSWLKS